MLLDTLNPMTPQHPARVQLVIYITSQSCADLVSRDVSDVSVVRCSHQEPHCRSPEIDASSSVLRRCSPEGCVAQHHCQRDRQAPQEGPYGP